MLLLLLLACAPTRALVRPPPGLPTATAPTATPPRALAGALVAELALARGDLAEAESATHAALLLDPTSAHLWLLSARVAQSAGGDAAQQRLERARALAPDDPDVLLALGDAALAAGREEDAMALWREAEAGRPAEALRRLAAHGEGLLRYAQVPLEDVHLRRERGVALLAAGEDALAVADLVATLRNEPESPVALERLVRATRTSHRYRTTVVALLDLARSSVAPQDLALQAWHLADEAADRTRATDALHILDDLAGGRDGPITLALAEHLQAGGASEAAQAALHRLDRADPPLTDRAFHVARVLAESDAAAALRALRIPADGPQHVPAEALHVHLLLRAGRTSEAHTAAEAALTELAGDYTLLGARTSVAVAERDRAGALALVERMTMLPPDARTRQRARVLDQLGDLEGALAALATPDAPADSVLLRATLLGARDRWAEAADVLAATPHPTAGTWSALATARLRLSDPAAARQAWLAARALDPWDPGANAGLAGDPGVDLEGALDRHPGDLGLVRARLAVALRDQDLPAVARAAAELARAEDTAEARAQAEVIGRDALGDIAKR